MSLKRKIQLIVRIAALSLLAWYHVPALAETTVPPDKAQEFEIKREAFHGLWPESDFAVVPGYEASYTLYHCTGPTDVLGKEAVSQNDFTAVLAMDIAFLQRGLETTGAPRDVWQPLVEKFVADALANDNLLSPAAEEAYRVKYQGFLEQMTADLNRDIVRHPAKWPKNMKVRYDPMTGCGGGIGKYFGIDLSQKGDLFVISRWSSLVCEGQKISPFDRSKCRGWKPVGVPSTEPFRGDLIYSVNWETGKVSSGVLDLAKRPNISQVVISPGGPAYTLRKDDDY